MERIKNEKVMTPQMKGVKTHKNTPSNTIEVNSQTPQKFFVCYSVVNKVQNDLYIFRRCSYSTLNSLK
jgi:hypothetical protein